MSDPQPDQNGMNKVVAVVSALLLVKFLAAENDLIAKFGLLIGKYAVGDLLLFQMRKAAQAEAQALRAQTPRLMDEIIQKAIADGKAAPVPPVPDAPPVQIDFLSHAERAAQAIRDDLVGKLNSMSLRITRFADDAYQSVTSGASIEQVLGSTPAEAQQIAFRNLTSKGIDGFTDSRGRNWSLSSYVEMAVRTSSQRAFNVAHLARMQSVGVKYFTVTDDGSPCPLCAPWQGAILTAGDTDEIASASIEDATSAGLFHPNCRHTLVAYFPGITKLPPPHEWSDADQKAYDVSQRQRAIERQIRAAKREVAGAFTPAMKQKAQQKLKAAQASMRSFLNSTGRVRNTRREQLDLGLKQ